MSTKAEYRPCPECGVTLRIVVEGGGAVRVEVDDPVKEEVPTHVDLSDPEWKKAGKVHDWRNHVPGLVKESWGFMGFEARYYVYLTAEKMAESEVWE